MEASPENFKAALRNFPAGVTVVTSVDEAGLPVGATVSSFASVSADPPMVLVCLHGLSRSAQAVRRTKAFSVHILNCTQSELAMRFAQDLGEKFPGNRFEPSATGAPALPECEVRLDCELASETPGGTHGIFIAHVRNIVTQEINPLIYANRTFCGAQTLDAVAGT